MDPHGYPACRKCRCLFNPEVPSSRYCSETCRIEAKRERDREHRQEWRKKKRDRLGRDVSPQVEAKITRITVSYVPGDPVFDTASPIPDIQPAAVSLVQQRAQAFLDANASAIRNDLLQRYAFMRGLTQLDADEIWMFMQGKTRTAAPIAVVDPPPAVELDSDDDSWHGPEPDEQDYGSLGDIDYGLDD